jgi:hypothetical protein
VADNIFSTIRGEERDFIDNFIQPVQGWSFNQYQTIKRIHLYLNSRFENGGKYLNRDLVFYNVVVPPVQVATKMLNLDTKNIRLLPMNPKSRFSTWLLEKELKQWLKTSKMGKILNQIAEEAPAYGSVVLEKTTDGAKVVDLRRLILDPSVENIKDSRFVTTVHYMTPSQLRATGWKNVEEAIATLGNKEAEESYLDDYGNMTAMQSSPYIKVYKRYGEVPKRWLDGGNSEEMVKALYIVAGADQELKDAQGKSIGEAGVELFSSKWSKDWPFKDFHYFKSKGRWLGVGIVEMLFDTQVRINEIKNQKRISMELSSMHLFQTRDKSIVRNLLTDLESGDLVISQNGIEPIANEERNLAAFDGEEASYNAQVDRLSFAYEAIRGDQSANQTLGQTQIAVSQGTSVYAFKKENLALFFQEFFNDLVMPQLMKDLTAEHIMRFIGDSHELEKLDLAAAEVYANDYIKSEWMRGNLMTTKEDEDFAKMKALAEYKKLGQTRFLKIKDAFYDDAEFEFDFLITNEQVDPAQLSQNLQAVLAPLLQQGGLADPRVKLLYYKFADMMGVSSAEIEMADQQSQQMPAPMQPMQPMQMPQPNQPMQ